MTPTRIATPGRVHTEHHFDSAADFWRGQDSKATANPVDPASGRVMVSNAGPFMSRFGHVLPVEIFHTEILQGRSFGGPLILLVSFKGVVLLSSGAGGFSHVCFVCVFRSCISRIQNNLRS